MAGQRCLLILDNAASSAQVTPLLPAAGCLVLVTSRRFLGDLPAAAEMPLDVLPPAEAAAMFADLAPRSASDPDRVAEIVALCGHLPLAISLLARLFTRHRSWTMADLIDQTRARLLTVTAENRTVAAAFEASYQNLDAGRQRFFRHLGLHPGPDIDACAAAALAGLPPGEVAMHLDALYSDRLLEERVTRRYRMHDLIGQYARSLAAGESGDDRERATGRLLDYYQHTAQAADVQLARHTRPATTAFVTVPAAAPGRIQAQAWMAAEQANLAACIDFALTRGDHARVTGLTAAIAAHLRSDGPWPRAIILHAAAARAARHAGDRPGHASALLNLGDIQYLTSDIPAATEALQQARDIYRDIGDRLGEASALYSLGVACQTGGVPGAADLLTRSLDIFRYAGDQLGEANALSSLGIGRCLAADFAAATGPLEQAIGIFRDIGNPPGESNALRSLGDVRQATGDYPGATSLLQQALNICRANADRHGEAMALLGLGAVRRLTGDYPGATLVLEQAIGIHRRMGNRRHEAYALQYLADARQAIGDLPGAAGLLEQSLDICRDIGARLGEAYAQLSLAHVRRAAGDLPAAACVLAQAMNIFRHLGAQGGQAEALIETGAVHLARGDPQQARLSYQHALELARATGARLEEARALEGTGKCAARVGDATAGIALRQALEIYQRLGAADGPRLAAELDSS